MSFPVEKGNHESLTIPWTEGRHLTKKQSVRSTRQGTHGLDEVRER